LPLDGFVNEKLDASYKKSFSYEELLQFFKKAPGETILVDNTSSVDLAKAYPLFLKNGIHIATPNKKAFSSDQKLWDDVFASSSYANPEYGHVYHEAATCAGLPVIGTLRDLVATGDEIVKIEGVFSGTMSFIFNEFAPVKSDGPAKKFSDVVKVAQASGFTVYSILSHSTRTLRKEKLLLILYQ